MINIAVIYVKHFYYCLHITCYWFFLFSPSLRFGDNQYLRDQKLDAYLSEWQYDVFISVCVHVYSISFPVHIWFV